MPKNLLANAGDPGDIRSIPELGRSPGEGNSNALQYSCLENPMDRGVSQAIALGVTKSQTDHAHAHTHVDSTEFNMIFIYAKISWFLQVFNMTFGGP